MKAYKARIKLNILKQAMKIPAEITSPEVEIIILSESQETKSPRRGKRTKNLLGILNRYARPELIKHEKEIAWTKVVNEKHGLL